MVSGSWDFENRRSSAIHLAESTFVFHGIGSCGMKQREDVDWQFIYLRYGLRAKGLDTKVYRCVAMYIILYSSVLTSFIESSLAAT
jgi:hypothetical protein